MIVDRFNFTRDFIDSFKSKLKSPNLDYIAIDLEMTGVPTEYYGKRMTPSAIFDYTHRLPCSKYGIIQIGISLFHKTKTIDPFTFYLFPRTLPLDKINSIIDISNEENLRNNNSETNNGIPRNLFDNCSNRSMDLSIGAVEFNDFHDMDFQKWVNGGISYMPEYQGGKYLRERLNILKSIQDPTCRSSSTEDGNMEDEKQGSSRKRRAAQKPQYPQDLKILEEMYKRTESYVNQIKNNEEVTESLDLSDIDGNNDYLGRFFKESIQELYNGLVYYDIGSKSVDDMKRAINKLVEDLEKFLGFSLLWSEIIEHCQSQDIPLIFHNGFTDLVFIGTHFHNSNMSSISNFKRTFNNINIYDTRFLSQRLRHLVPNYQKMTGHSLGDLVGFFKEEEWGGFDFSEESDSFANENFHDAGYDASCTGKVFAMFREYLSENLANSICIFRSPFTMNLHSLSDSITNPLQFALYLSPLNLSINIRMEDVHDVVKSEIFKIIENSANLEELKNGDDYLIDCNMEFTVGNSFFFLSVYYSNDDEYDHVQVEGMMSDLYEKCCQNDYITNVLCAQTVETVTAGSAVGLGLVSNINRP